MTTDNVGGMTDAEALAHLDKVCGLPSLVTNLRGEKFTSIKSRHVRVHVAALIAERDALRQELRASENLMFARLDEARADRDRLAARCGGLEAALRLFKKAGFGNSTDFCIQAQAFSAYHAMLTPTAERAP